jgi:DNA ligase-1
MEYKPFLGSNEPLDLSALRFPLITTIKKDGVRAIVRKGEAFTRSYTSQNLPVIKNKQIQEMLNDIKIVSKSNCMSIDFEIYIHGLPLNEIVMFTNTNDIKSREHYNKVKSKIRELTKPFNYYLSIPKELEFYIFDSVIENREQLDYLGRLKQIKQPLQKSFTIVNPTIVHNIEQLKIEYENSLSKGFEGLVIRKIDSPYKYGRSTFKEHYFLKLKPIEKYEAEIVRINERMFNYNESTESFVGYKIKKDTIENKESSGIAATATVKWNNNEFKITLTGTEAERIKIWKNKDSYIGKKLIFKGMSYGMKIVPRFPTLIKIL